MAAATPFLSPRLFFLALFLPVLYFLDKNIHTRYIFDPQRLQEISQSAISVHGSNTTALLHAIHQDLRAEHGDAIVPAMPRSAWVWNNAGGAMGTMHILHASLTEYLIFFGTALQTEGHSGIHMADDYFTILVGEQYAAYPGDLEPRVYGPGMQNHLKRGDTIQYAMPKTCFALELAQGWIPAMLPFGFTDAFFSTLDYVTLWKTVKVTAIRMAEQAWRGKF